MTIRMLTALAALCALTACATKPGVVRTPGVEQPAFTTGCPTPGTTVESMRELVLSKVEKEGTRTAVEVIELRCRMSGTLLKIEAGLSNRSANIQRVAYKFRWIDREGMRAAEEEAWKPIMLYDSSNQIVSAIAPTPKAADFRLVLLSQE